MMSKKKNTMLLTILYISVAPVIVLFILSVDFFYLLPNNALYIFEYKNKRTLNEAGLRIHLNNKTYRRFTPDLKSYEAEYAEYSQYMPNEHIRSLFNGIDSKIEYTDDLKNEIKKLSHRPSNDAMFDIYNTVCEIQRIKYINMLKSLKTLSALFSMHYNVPSKKYENIWNDVTAFTKKMAQELLKYNRLVICRFLDVKKRTKNEFENFIIDKIYSLNVFSTGIKFEILYQLYTLSINSENEPIKWNLKRPINYFNF
ncbi:exported protein, unknown function [Hepatocystis sp. ex Piliocolobus tephrosceles]|nr:exported protein, unknown function [Hepatocystis sp. ex Piliocolobus tephrosceles]